MLLSQDIELHCSQDASSLSDSASQSIEIPVPTVNVDTTSSNILKRKYHKSAQEALRLKIQIPESTLNSKILARDSNLSTYSQTDISDTKNEFKKMKQKLKTRERNTEHQRKYRESMKAKISKICASNEDAAKTLKLRKKVGRPRFEEDQTELLKAITDIAIFGSTAHDRRRTEEIKSCKTPDDLHQCLI